MTTVYGLEENEDDRLKRLRAGATSIYGSAAPAVPTGVPNSTISQTKSDPQIATETDRRTATDTAVPAAQPPLTRRDPYEPTDTAVPASQPPLTRRDPYASPTTTATIGNTAQPAFGYSNPLGGGDTPPSQPPMANGLTPGGADTIGTPAGQAAPPAQNPDWYGQLWGMTQNQPQFGAVNATPGAQTQQLTDRLAATAQAPAPQIGGYGTVDPSMNANVQGLNQGATDLAMQMLSQPTRYDTDLFNRLFQGGLAELDQRNQRAKVDTLRDSTRRLGPQSGQLTNEYIDLEAEFGRQRTDLLSQLAREAALTQMQDRTGALSAARGVGDSIFGQDQSLRGEQRAERGFQRDTDVFNVGQQNQAADRLQSVQGQTFGQDQALRGEARQERDFGVQDRLRAFNEVDRFGQVDRQQGRDAMDDYYRQYGAETQSNEALARLMQSEFANNMALAQLFANMPGAVDPTGQDGAGNPIQAPPADPLVQNTQRQSAIRGFIGGKMPPEDFIRQARTAGLTDQEIQDIIQRREAAMRNPARAIGELTRLQNQYLGA